MSYEILSTELPNYSLAFSSLQDALIFCDKVTGQKLHHSLYWVEKPTREKPQWYLILYCQDQVVAVEAKGLDVYVRGERIYPSFDIKKEVAKELNVEVVIK